MKLFTSAAILALCTFGATGAAFADGCSGRDHTTGTVVGAVGGAAIGGAVSHDVGGAIVGGVLGGVAGNAIARSEDCDRQGYQGRGDDRGGYGGVYVQGNVGRESEGGADYRHISENIQRGRENGFYSASQARGYYQQLQQIRSRADWQQRNGRFDSEDIEVRLTRLRQTMHASREYGQGRDYRDDRR
jgi:5'-3' exoribonuclease 2